MVVWPVSWRNPSRFTMKHFRPVVGDGSQRRGNDRLYGRNASRGPAPYRAAGQYRDLPRTSTSKTRSEARSVSADGRGVATLAGIRLRNAGAEDLDEIAQPDPGTCPGLLLIGDVASVGLTRPGLSLPVKKGSRTAAA
jgi:hypothetical protein